MLTDEDRKYILNEFLRNIDHISDKNYQMRVWIRGEGPEVDDFDETVCNFFQNGDGIISNYIDFGLTNKQYEKLKLFRDEFKTFCSGPGLEYYLPQFFIDTPEWKEIMKRAKEVLDAFNVISKDF